MYLCVLFGTIRRGGFGGNLRGVSGRGDDNADPIDLSERDVSDGLVGGHELAVVQLHRDPMQLVGEFFETLNGCVHAMMEITEDLSEWAFEQVTWHDGS
ncbi:hypothetical protein D4765_11815 [Subtercola vilae]|uniref:Uncharacterized protein n=1 Tax=Subtercola vilae TaxID=2056433 RepID=A0A4T2BT89_9MICO|nr:hypothetical protein D4765_11815 [Subtercola vilae]